MRTICLVKLAVITLVVAVVTHWPSASHAALKREVVEVQTPNGLVKIHAEINRGKSTGATFVLVNGLIYDLSRWDRLTAELTRHGHTVIRYSFSAQPESLRLLKDDESPVFFANGLELEILSFELESVLEAFDVKEKIQLVGLSYGASVAAEFAKQSPEKIDNLIMMSPLVIPLENYEPQGRNLRVWLNSVRFWENAPCDFYKYVNPWLCSAKDFWYDSFYRAIYEPYLSNRVKNTPADIDPAIFKKSVFHLVRAARDFDLRGYGRDLSNVHFLVGKEDEPQLKSDQEEAWREISRQQQRSFIIFRGVHHAIPDESPLVAGQILNAIAAGDERLKNGSRFEIDNDNDNDSDSEIDR